MINKYKTVVWTPECTQNEFGGFVLKVCLFLVAVTFFYWSVWFKGRWQNRMNVRQVGVVSKGLLLVLFSVFLLVFYSEVREYEVILLSVYQCICLF